jgi:hypothetical protein
MQTAAVSKGFLGRSGKGFFNLSHDALPDYMDSGLYIGNGQIKVNFVRICVIRSKPNDDIFTNRHGKKSHQSALPVPTEVYKTSTAKPRNSHLRT